MVKIKNVYWMLAYAFNVLKEKGIQSVQTEEFENIYNLFAAILIKGVNYQIKKGLSKEYDTQTETLGNIKGKLMISKSIKENTIINHKMICEYDEFTENSYMNRIIKTTLELLLRTNDLEREYKNNIKKILIYFKDVKTLDSNNIDWNRIRYNKSNLTYKMIINVCYLILKGLLITTEEGKKKLNTFIDEQRMSALYERFVREYYRKHFPKLKATALHIDWDLEEDDVVGLLPDMKTDTTLKYKDKILIIDTKYYGKSLQSNTLYQKNTIYSGNLFQIFTYVKNMDKGSTGNVEGMLLYAKTDEEITPNEVHKMGGNRISIKTLDLTQDFEYVTKQLDMIAYEFTNNELIKID